MNQSSIATVDVKFYIEQQFQLDVNSKKTFDIVKHGFTRYQAHLYPILLDCREPKEVQGFQWLSKAALKELAFSSGHRRIFQQLNDD